MAKIQKTMDGGTASAYVAYAFTEVAAIYPITPSTIMSEAVDEWASSGKQNIFNQPVGLVEMQSEAGAAAAIHGSLATGALSTTFTASQGLLLMIPNMYKMAGELLPAVIHVSARAIATHALSIFGDHSDVMAVRQTGFAMLASGNVQEVMDLGAVAHLTAIKGRVPFVSFYDGFRTSHEIQKIDCLDYDDLSNLVDREALEKFRNSAVNPENPTVRGTSQNPDIFFQASEARNSFYNALPSIVEEEMNKINKLTGRDYKLFNYYGAADADKIIIAMGSVTDTIEETIDYLNASGQKLGLVKVHLYRPFSIEHLMNVIPKTVNKIAVLDRTKEPGAIGEPLYLDICTSYFEMNEKPIIVGGRYGLASKEVTPNHIISVFDNLSAEEPKRHFTIGIEDDITNLSLETGENLNITDKDTISCKIWGLGSDGTVGANKNSIKIIGENTPMYVQAYFAYDSKKSGGITQSHLRFGKNLIRSPYLVSHADFVACHNETYLETYDVLKELKDGGTFLLNCSWNEEELEKNIPAKMKKEIASRNIKLYTINGTAIAKELGLRGRINTILQASFFKLSKIIEIDDAVKYMKEAIVKSYGKKGDKIINMNYAAVEAGITNVKEISIKEAWKTVDTSGVVSKKSDKDPAHIQKLVHSINNLQGDLLPVSAFLGHENGVFETGTSTFEKRGIATEVPEWIEENCIQCNKCAYVCPHAVIRPFLLDSKESENKPNELKTIGAVGKGMDGFQYVIQVDPLDCTGCSSCVQVCPGNKNGKALSMKPIETQMKQQDNWDYALTLSKKDIPLNKATVKGSQFEQPLLEFSGACAGCGETPYAKLVTQLYGDRMNIANATGCSSIWGGTAPATPYTKNQLGHGPAWANSLFEDNAEFGYGMFLGTQQLRSGLCLKIEKIITLTSDNEKKTILQNWVDNYDNSEESKIYSNAVIRLLEEWKTDGEIATLAKDILDKRQYLVIKSQWIFGGDGWAYDIGFGGLDHVIASGANVNILIFDTELYSNTGGQASKSTPRASVAKLASAGKKSGKKDLGMIAMSYRNVYVAQVAMGADANQCIKAITEAEKYPGPSIIIAYAPCISHGIDMSMTQEETKLAVECGYWSLYRFNPLLTDEGKNPLTLDSKEPNGDYKEFLKNEGRYSSLVRTFPEIADKLFEESEKDAIRKLEIYKNLAEMKEKI
jgi:pyruvate-ferredoxin/flavodoxin oxidoreductase